MIKTSAYERIKECIGVDGKLPHTFSLDKKPQPNQIGFMPGAMDGIGVFYAGRADEEKLVKQVVSLLKKYFKTGSDRYICKIEKTIADGRAISLIDPILQSLRDDHKGIEPNKVFRLSFQLVQTSENTEIVKISLGLLGLFDLGNSDEVADVVATLAAYDDFTLYAVVAVSNWTNGNELIFRIAKSVDGWGKIHAVERLEPETEEIREWILRDGCSNSVMDAYLGLVCAVKGDLISALQQDSIENDMFGRVAVIIDALLDEGPIEGISEYEHAEEALRRYLHHAKTSASSIEHLWRILNLRGWAEDAEVDYREEILAQCAEIINRPEWPTKVIAAIASNNNNNFEFFCACNAANCMDIDASAELFTVFKANPLKHYGQISTLMKKPEIAAQIIEICETILPLEDMAEGMGDYLFSNKLNQEHQCLDFILPELADYPLQGVKLIKTGLNSRVVRGRNMACRALSGWSKHLDKPISDISLELYDEIARIYKIEVNEQTKETMQKLLNGEAEDIC